jgi:hypothetical protein
MGSHNGRLGVVSAGNGVTNERASEPARGSDFLMGVRLVGLDSGRRGARALL